MKALRQFVAIGLLLGFYNVGQAQSNTSPMLGTVSANSVAAGIVVPPDNDICANAQSLFCGDVILGSTVGANDEVVPSPNSLGAGVWYRFVGTGLNVTFSTCSANSNPDFDSQISVFTGSCGAFSFLAQNDDDLFCNETLQSTLTIATTLDELYYVYVSDRFILSSDGDFQLSVSCESATNAVCANAIALGCGDGITGLAYGASQEVIPTFDGNTTGAGLWYTFTGTGGYVEFSTCGANTGFDTEINVLTGSCGSWTNVGGNDDGMCNGFDNITSLANVATNYGELYYVYVSSYVEDGTGNIFWLSTTCAAPQNDVCANATPISCGNTVQGSTLLAGIDGPLTTCEGDGFSYAADVWYRVVGNGQDLTASLCSSLYDTKIDIYESDCANYSCVAFDDDFCVPGSQVTWTSTQGTEYLIRVHGYSGQVGQYELGVTCICSAFSGTLVATNSTETLVSGSATISAITADTPVVPVGYLVTYVLTSGANLTIIDTDDAPNFTVAVSGDYTIHTLVYNAANSATLFASTTGVQLNALLVQGGGTICGSLDVTGAAITVDNGTGISSALNRSLSVYPNPNNGQFVVQLKGEGKATLNILDMMGRRVYTQAMTLNGMFRQAISLDVAKGTYVLQVITSNGIATRKVEVN